MKQRFEDVRDNVIKVLGDNTFGTGFFIHKELCVTCHHVICRMDKISIEHNHRTFDAEWVPEYSDMDKDIAVLKVRNDTVIPLECAKETTPKLEVSLWGFTQETKTNLPAGVEVGGKLLTATTKYERPAEQITGNKPWNKKPKVEVEVYRLECTYAGIGLSGAPVWEPNRGKVVGMFIAVQGPDPDRDVSNVGYVIPIEAIIEFQKESKVDETSTISDAGKLLEEGNKYYYEKDFLKAIERYDLIISDNNYAYAWNNRALCFEKLGNYDEAIKCYDKAIEIDPDYSSAWYNKANLFSNQERHDEAIKCYDKAIAIDPNYGYAWNDKGSSLVELGDYDRAVKCYNIAIWINPNDAGALRNKGFALQNLGDYDEAIKYYDKAIEIDPNYGVAWNDKGAVLFDQKHYDEAIKYYDKAITIDPNFSYPWHNKGLVLAEKELYDEAIKCYDKAIAIDPNYAPAWYSRAISRIKSGDKKNSYTDLKKAIEINKLYAESAKQEEAFRSISNEERFKLLTKN